MQLVSWALRVEGWGLDLRFAIDRFTIDELGVVCCALCVEGCVLRVEIQPRNTPKTQKAKGDAESFPL